MDEFPFGYVQNKQGQDSHAIASWNHIDDRPDNLATTDDVNAAFKSVPKPSWNTLADRPTDLATQEDLTNAIKFDSQLINVPIQSPLTGSLRAFDLNHVWYLRGDIEGYTPSDGNSQLIGYLPFMTNLMTFRGNGDSSGTPLLVIFGNQLLLQKTVGTGGTIRFVWSIPEELL